MHVGFLIHLSSNCILEAFAGLDESGNGRVAAVRPIGLTAEKASLAILNQHDDGRVDARKNFATAVVIGTDAGITSGRRPGR